MKIKSYKELNVWKLGIEIVDLVYETTKDFPANEKFGLISQMQRASISIPSNIAEGFARGYINEYKRFCYISLSSCSELETQVIIAIKRNYLSEEKSNLLTELLDRESKMLMNLIKKLTSINQVLKKTGCTVTCTLKAFYEVISYCPAGKSQITRNPRASGTVLLVVVLVKFTVNGDTAPVVEL